MNFRQDDWGTPTEEGSALHGAADNLATWLIPTADRYVFVIKGAVGGTQDMARAEAEVERRLSGMTSISSARLAAAKAAVRQQLVEDVESTEDAAHQLAYFEGIGALEMLLALPSRIGAVMAEDVLRVARQYLTLQQRTVAWMVPGERNRTAALGAGQPAPATLRTGEPPRSRPAPAPALQKLGGGLPLIIQPSPLTPTIAVQLLMSAPSGATDQPRELAGLETITQSAPASALPTMLKEASKLVAARAAKPTTPRRDPASRMQQLIQKVMNAPRAEPRPALLVIAGSVDPALAAGEAAKHFGSNVPAAAPAPIAISEARKTVRETIDLPLSQGSIGYVARTAPPGTKQGLAARLLLYILTHDYSGRLGRSAINDKGLAYHIYSAFRTDGANGWVTIWSGVDPAKAEALEEELRAQLAGLIASPPTAAEIDAAKRHLLGRDLSTAQSNGELAAKLTRDLVETGGLRSHQALRQALSEITASDLADVARSFGNGTVIRVDVGAPRLAAKAGAKGAQ